MSGSYKITGPVVKSVARSVVTHPKQPKNGAAIPAVPDNVVNGADNVVNGLNNVVNT